MNDTDISPGSGPVDDSTEKTRPGPPSSSKNIEPESTEKSLPDEQTEKVAVAQTPLAPNPTTDAAATAVKADLQAVPQRATMVPKGGMPTGLLGNPGATDYAALLSPDQETFIPEAGVGPLLPAHSLQGYPSVPGFDIVGTLGRGGMGVVYKARHQGLGRWVALKMILHGNLASASDLARFHREAESIARLQHPHIVQIYEIGDYKGLPFFSLEYVDGGTLAQKMGGMPQPNAEAAQVVETLARAMAFAHGRGIVHRDLKPANILLESGETRESSLGDGVAPRRPLTSYQPKIVDFGLAKRLDELSGQTHSGAIMGTPSYMSPEQADGRNNDIGPAADIYALGAILYEMLTGRPPFRAEKPMDTIRMVIQEEPVPPVRLNPGVARDLETICLKCLQKESAKRYPTAGELAEDLRRFLDGAPINARPVTHTERALKWVRRRPALAAVYGLLVMVTFLGGLGGILAWRWYEADSARREIEKALKGEQRALESAARAQEQVEQLSYIYSINLAGRDWNASEVMRARKLVDDCDPKRRHWEWHYLHRQVFPELLTLADYADEPLQVLFAPDGKRLLIIGKNNELSAREAATGRDLPAPLGGAAVQYIACHPDGKRIAAAGTDNTVQLWNAAAGRLLHKLMGHEQPVVHLAFSPDGARLASASWDKTVKVWDVASGKEVFSLKGHGAEVAWVAFRPDGRQIATASWDTTVKIWDAATGMEIKSPPIGQTDALTQVVYSPDGKRLATASVDKTVKLWNAATFAELPPLLGPMEDINSLAFSPDSSRIAFAKRDKTLKIFDLASGKPLFFLQGHFAEVTHAAYSPDGGRLVSTGKDKTVKVWDATAGKETLVLQGAIDNINDLAYSPDGRHRLAVCMDKTVKVWDTDTGKQLAACVGHADEVMHLAYHPGGLRLATASRDKTVRIWDALTGEELHVLKGHGAEVTQVAYSPDGTRLVSGGLDHAIHLWDADTGKDLLALKIGGGAVLQLAFRPDGRQVAVAAKGSPALVWDTVTDRYLSAQPDDRVLYLAYNPAGTQLATACLGLQGPRLWDASSGKPSILFTGHTEDVAHLAFSPDGRWLATASKDKTVNIYDVQARTMQFTLKGHIGDVVSVAFSPDGRRLASGSWDRTVKLWDVQTGKELLSLPGHAEEVTSVIFSPDGDQLASTSRGAVKIWDGSRKATNHER